MEWAQRLSRPRAVVAMSTQALECDDSAPMVGFEAIRLCQRARPRHLAEHHPLARAPDVDLVEERGDGGVVLAEELQPLERAVVLLVEVLDGGIAHLVARS